MISKINLIKISPSRYRIVQNFELPLVGKYVEITKERNKQGKFTYLSSIIADSVNGKKIVESGTTTVMHGAGLKDKEVEAFHQKAMDLTESFSDNFGDFGNGFAFIRTGLIDKKRYLKILNDFFMFKN